MSIANLPSQHVAEEADGQPWCRGGGTDNHCASIGLMSFCLGSRSNLPRPLEMDEEPGRVVAFKLLQRDEAYVKLETVRRMRMRHCHRIKRGS